MGAGGRERRKGVHSFPSLLNSGVGQEPSVVECVGNVRRAEGSVGSFRWAAAKMVAIITKSPAYRAGLYLFVLFAVVEGYGEVVGQAEVRVCSAWVRACIGFGGLCLLRLGGMWLCRGCRAGKKRSPR